MKNFRQEDFDDREEVPGRKKSFVKQLLGLLAGSILLGFLAAVILQGVNLYQDKQDRKGTVGPESIDEMDVPENLLEESTDKEIAMAEPMALVTDVSSVVENVMPAVVAIRCEAETVTTVYDFFGRGYESKEKSNSAGTGIIIAQNANELLIVTNNHVIDNATKIEIAFCDGQTTQATVRGTEEANDLAVIAVAFSDLESETMNRIRIATLGDSNEARLGEMVIAIGNALGYGQSTTVGYISAVNREVEVDDIELNLIQVDAAINPGNSGGALLNANGEVIGINSVKYSATEVEGVGYAIPISEVIPIINDLMNREELHESEMAYLGIEGKNIDEALSQSFRMPVGIYVSRIGEDTPAERAGLHQGDIIVGINHRTLATMEDLQKVLCYTRGDTVVTLQLKVLENGTYVEKELEVQLGYRPEE
ncbi:MAG: trypsin-like peptidase domain-containing protein [Lachnospiraceae bacterium]|nr:trypsin-like peptidase domain-containing protein [Lachnospiraceae bacterium]